MIVNTILESYCSPESIVTNYYCRAFVRLPLITPTVTGGLCALGGVFILTLPIPIVVNSFASYYKNRLWRNEVAYKKRQRAKKRKEMELLMRDNLLNILTVPGNIWTINLGRLKMPKMLTVFYIQASAVEVRLTVNSRLSRLVSINLTGFTFLNHLSFFIKMKHPGLFFIYFRLFKQTLHFLQQTNVKKCPFSILHWDSNPQLWFMSLLP